MSEEIDLRIQIAAVKKRHEDAMREEVAPLVARLSALPARPSTRDPCCSVGFSGSDHFPRGVTWYVWWLPRGYATTPEDRILCAFPDQGWNEYGLGGQLPRPPLIEAVCKRIEQFMKDEA